MRYIFLHLGLNRDIPRHIWVAMRQFRKFNPLMPATLLVNKELANDDNIKRNCDEHSVSLETVSDHRAYSFVHIQNEKPYDPWDFWNTAARRVFHLRDYMAENNVCDIYHADNDVMIYEDIQNKIHPICYKHYKNIAITRTKWQDLVFSFAYINNPAAIDRVCKFTKWALENRQVLQTRVGMDMIHEMSIMSAMQNFDAAGILRELPTVPTGVFENNYQSDYADEFGGVFDGAGYGHWFGGWWGNNNKPGHVDKTHYIGQGIINGVLRPELVDSDKGKVPIVKNLENNTSTPIFSIHVHSKNLEAVAS